MDMEELSLSTLHKLLLHFQFTKAFRYFQIIIKCAEEATHMGCSCTDMNTSLFSIFAAQSSSQFNTDSKG
jgi:hypothetical protein